MWKCGDVRSEPRDVGGPFDGIALRFGLPEGDIARERILEQHRLLRHHANRLA